MCKTGLSIRFFNGENKLIEERLLMSVALKEDQVIKKSVEFFNDPEPCMIHKSAVMRRLYSEIEEFFLAHICGAPDKVEWLTVPLCCREYMEVPEDVAFVSAGRTGK